MKRSKRRSDCPVHFALQVFGDAWTLLVVRDLMFKGRTTYTDFLNGEEGIATNILADRLARLEQHGVVTQSKGDDARSVRYRLTRKGIDLLPILLEMIDWSAKHDPNTAAERRFVRRVRTDRSQLIAEIRQSLISNQKESPT